jgi:hypothetical protein
MRELGRAEIEPTLAWHLGIRLPDHRRCNKERRNLVQTLRSVSQWIGAALFMVFTTAVAFKWQPPEQRMFADTEQIERGRYLVKIAGCNDCHTAGYVQNAGEVPETEWLTGNLRTYMNDISETQWVTVAHSADFRPHLPWIALHDMTEQDLRAIYHFVQHLGPSSGPPPSYLPRHPRLTGRPAP